MTNTVTETSSMGSVRYGMKERIIKKTSYSAENST
jgi:hypothetical protein